MCVLREKAPTLGNRGELRLRCALQGEVVNRTSPHQHAVWVCVLRVFGMRIVLGVKSHQFADVCVLVEGFAFSKDPEKHVA